MERLRSLSFINKVRELEVGQGFLGMVEGW